MTFTKQQLEEMVGAVPFWFHSIDLGQGVVTAGHKSQRQLAVEVENFRFPDLRGKSVLDINAWDGFYSFEAERRGAARVVALDEYMWAMDLAEHTRYWKECMEKGVTPRPYHTMPYYRPDELPGKKGFDTARRALGSSVEEVVGDFMGMNLAPLGQFDVVFYLGSLYHMENPLEAVKRVAAVTREVAVVETEAVAFEGLEGRAVCEFFESNELNGDVSNWWAPNERALAGLCRAAGFARVEVVVTAPPFAPPAPQTALGSLRHRVGRALHEQERKIEPVRYRAVVHAYK